MGVRGTVLILAAMGLLCGITSVKAQGKHPLPKDHAAMVEQLITHAQESYLANLELSKAKPEETFEITRDNWKNIGGAAAKQMLLFVFVRSDNPHMMEILDLGAMDNNASVQYQAFDMLQNFAYRNFINDPAAYRTWRDSVKGKSLADIVTDGCKAFVEQYIKADEVERTSLLNVLMRLEFGDSSALAQVRRRAALDAGILAGLEKALAPPVPTNPTVIYVVRNLQPDEAFVKRAILPLTTKNSPQYIRYAAASILGAVKSAWASDLLFNMLMDDYPSSDSWIFLQALSTATDPHLIPKMIALLEADDSQDTAQLLNLALRKLTDNKVDRTHDGGWWHIWWDRNKTSFSEDVQAIPFPKVIVRRSIESNAFYIRRRAELHLLGDDPQRAYWLLCPAYIAPTTAQNGPVPPPRKPTFGLIVALAGGSGNGEDLTDFWQDAIQKSLKDGYFVALPIAPKWSAHQPAAWLTQQNIGQVKDARFSTEAFLQDIVKDVKERYPIDPGRLFLHGIGEGGLAAYACSLSDTTPFRGFYILSAPFKTAQLPPLTHARGRRYLIQQSKDDKVTPYFQAAAADELLRKQAAVVKLVVTKGEHGYKFAENPWEQITQDIGWLEAPH
ncbi:MAG: Phospholipase/Carboxylesterase [Chthonomonadaceae bacterium]|nr:Phospholipase/Carboxylesterase [Chthonomonadaceae bacterium]